MSWVAKLPRLWVPKKRRMRCFQKTSSWHSQQPCRCKEEYPCQIVRLISLLRQACHPHVAVLVPQVGSRGDGHVGVQWGGWAVLRLAQPLNAHALRQGVARGDWHASLKIVDLGWLGGRRVVAVVVEREMLLQDAFLIN